jgi:hypothetical protein
VQVSLQNDELLGGFSIPIVFDPVLLQVKSISFSGSRGQHIDTKIITPADIQEISGHFLVTAIKVFEDPIPAGDGLLFTILFSVSDTAAVGEVAVIDSLFYPPGGSLVLSEDSTTTGIFPAFRAGKVVVRGENQRPILARIPDQSVIEGDSLVLPIHAVDPDDDPVALAATSKPISAEFVDNGDGTGYLVWAPDFVGPFSADGSPFTLCFWAGDGDLSMELQVPVEVVNRNRAPVISSPDTVVVLAGELAGFSISAADPDFEPVTWSVIGLPDGAVFDGENPGHFGWQPPVKDSGIRLIEFVAADPHGYADTGTVAIKVMPATLYYLSLDTAEAMPTETAEIPVLLDNKSAVGSFNLLVNHDASALSVISLTNSGTRSELFEYFNVVLDEDGFPGNLRIVGIADPAGDPARALPAGDGAIATIRFQVSGDLSFSGMSIPIRFWFLDSPVNDDNTLCDENGAKIGQSEISYRDGWVNISSLGEVLIGDINLNGLAYEIADVIRLTNYFLNPIQYGFNALQYINSDVNRDGLAATVADLVSLINAVVSGNRRVTMLSGGAETYVSVRADTVDSHLTMRYDSDAEVGGVLVTLGTTSTLLPEDVHGLFESMIVDYRQHGDEVKVLLYSLDGAGMPAGAHEFLTIANIDNLEIEAVDLAFADGRYAEVLLNVPSPRTPDDFALHQNYPNPFNPETRIDFDLPTSSRVELAVYNILGRRIKVLADTEYPAGAHSVVWDGRDENGRAVSSGVYFYRLHSGSLSQSRKMVLLK